MLWANFKLSTDNESAIVLTAADKSWSDTLIYCTHNAQQTVGLYPDGGTMVFLFEQPTICAPNQFSMYAAIWDEPGNGGSTVGVDAIQEDGSQPDNIIFDLAGRQIGTLHNSKQLPHGIYIINGH